MAKRLNVIWFLLTFFLSWAPIVVAQGNANNVLDTRKQVLVNTARDIEKLNAALLNYWQDNRSWPVALNQLVVSGYINQIPVSPKGTPYVGASVNGNRQYRISFDLVDNISAATVAGVLPNGTVVGSVVSTLIETPNSSNEYQTALGRNLDPDFADRVVMKNNLDMNGNNLNNAQDVDANNLNSTNITSQSLTSKYVTVGRAVVGSSTLQSNGTNLRVSSPNAFHSNDASVTRNANVSGGVQANNLATNNMNVRGSITSSNGNLTGFNNASGSSANITSVNAGSISTGALSASSGSATNATVATANIGRGTFATATTSAGTAQSATAQSGTVNTASGGAVTAQAFTGNQVATSQLNAQNSSVGTAAATSLNVTNQLTSASATGTTASSRALNAITLNASNSSVQDVRANTAQISGAANITGRMVANQSLGVTTLKADSAQFGNVNIRNGADIAGTTTTQNLQVDNSLQTSNIGAQTANITSLTGSGLTATNLNAQNVQGQNFTGSDFTTGISSVSNNRALITDQKNKLDNCMYVSTYCFPKAPVINNPVCPNCTQSGYMLNFNATASATITSCQHGCTYEWLVGGGASANCPSGTIPKMDSGSVPVSCTITRAQGEGTNSAGTISLIVKNTRRTDYQTSRNFNYAFTSSAASIPAASISCNNCSSTTSSENPVTFTSMLTANVANCEYGCSVTWGGACSNTVGNMCSYSQRINPGTTHDTTASVTVASNANAAKNATASRAISFKLDYPACPANQARENGLCQCPTGTIWNGSSCAGCTGGRTLVNGTCQCPAGLSWDGSTCVPIRTPTTPVITSLSCPTCTATSTAASPQTFNMTITADYNNCRTGQCSITWGAAPANFNKTNCPNIALTDVNADAGTATCQLSTTVTPGTSHTGTIALEVRNATDTSLVANQSQSMNITLNNVAERVWRSGCYVDTRLGDSVTDRSCRSNGTRLSNQPPAISFSVGDIIRPDNYFQDTFTLSSTAGITVVWTGDCTPSGTGCIINGPCGDTPSQCKGLGVKTATVRLYENGILKHQQTITAIDNSKAAGDIEQ